MEFISNGEILEFQIVVVLKEIFTPKPAMILLHCYVKCFMDLLLQHIFLFQYSLLGSINSPCHSMICFWHQWSSFIIGNKIDWFSYISPELTLLNSSKYTHFLNEWMNHSIKLSDTHAVIKIKILVVQSICPETKLLPSFR